MNTEILFQLTENMTYYKQLANQPPPAAFVRPSGVGGVEASWKDDFFPAVM